MVSCIKWYPGHHFKAFKLNKRTNCREPDISLKLYCWLIVSEKPEMNTWDSTMIMSQVWLFLPSNLHFAESDNQDVNTCMEPRFQPSTLNWICGSYCSLWVMPGGCLAQGTAGFNYCLGKTACFLRPRWGGGLWTSAVARSVLSTGATLVTIIWVGARSPEWGNYLKWIHTCKTNILYPWGGVILCLRAQS